jgi:uncharacterized protein (TIGR00299 family) protein
VTAAALDKGLHLHFDPCSGVAGDMTVAALVDAGVPDKVVRDAVRSMGLPGLKLTFERRKRGAFVGLGLTVDWPGKVERQARKQYAHPHDHHHDAGDHHHEHAHHDHHHHADDHHHHEHGAHHDHSHGLDHTHTHRDYAEIRRLLRRAKLAPKARSLAFAIFERIAHAEAALHGVAVDKVAFHEVGAWDSIADVVAASAALAWLEPSGVTSAPLVLGSGTIRTAHGLMPVPAPATAAILRGVPTISEGHGELTTPTGAAILAEVVQAYSAPPPMRMVAQGFGAGTREHADRPNVLRVLVGASVGQPLPASAAEVVVLAANIDDMSPQLAEPLMTALFAAGALDVWFTPILMKKGRPALEVSALCPIPALANVERALFANSTTIGVRRHLAQRTVLDRALAKVRVSVGEVRVKLAARDGEILGATPEFEDCRRLAQRAAVPVRGIVAEASAAAFALTKTKSKPRGR